MAALEYDLGRSRAKHSKMKRVNGGRQMARRTSTEGTIPDQLSGDTECAGDTEQDGVELHLRQSVVGQQNARVGVDIGPGVLGFAGLAQKLRTGMKKSRRVADIPRARYRARCCKSVRRA
jgi:hypothetical protein